MSKVERVALYARVSTEEQSRHGLSLAEQEHSLIEYAKKHKMKVVDTYIDAGISARKRYTKRPELLRLLEDVKAGKIDTILFIKLDRWFRDVSGYYDVQKILDQYHVSWRATQEDYETVTASGRFKVNIMLSVAQDEADRTSERIKFVFQGKRERNETVTGNVPYGYRVENKHIVKDEKTAPIARKIFDIYLETGSPSKVIEAVTEKQLSYQSLRYMLKMEAYTGNYNGLSIEPIITREEYERVQRTLKTIVRKNQTNTVYLFSGLMKCPKCGGRLTGLNPYKRGDGVLHYLYYSCNRYRRKSGCPEKMYCREDRIEQYLLDHIDYKLSALVNTKHMQKQISREPERRLIIKKLSKLSELYVNDLIEMPDYKRQYEQLQLALADIPQDQKPKEYENAKRLFVKDWKALYHELPREQKRLFWRNALEEIMVKDGEVIDFIFK